MPIGGGFGRDACGCNGRFRCTSRTEPIALAGLCLDDKPIALVVTRDCEGEVNTEGWVDLTTGQFTEGEPPEGVERCKQDINLEGVEVKLPEDLTIDVDTSAIVAAIEDLKAKLTEGIEVKLPDEPIKVDLGELKTALENLNLDIDAKAIADALKAALEGLEGLNVELDATAIADALKAALEGVKIGIDDTDPISVEFDPEKLTAALKAAFEDVTVDIDATALADALKAALEDVTVKLDPDTKVKVEGPVEVTGTVKAELDEPIDVNITGGEIKVEPGLDCETLVVNDGRKSFLRTICYRDGKEVSRIDATLEGEEYTAQGEVKPGPLPDEEESAGEPEPTTRCQTLVMHDGSCTEFLRTVCRDQAGELVSAADTLLDATTPYTPKNAAGESGDDHTACVTAGPSDHCDCEESGESWGEYDDDAGVDCEPVLLHDSKREFLRTICYDTATGAEVSRRDETLEGKAYKTEGEVKPGPIKVTVEVEGGGEYTFDPGLECDSVLLHDATTDFLRTTCRDKDGKVVSSEDTDLEGKAYKTEGEVKPGPLRLDVTITDPVKVEGPVDVTVNGEVKLDPNTKIKVEVEGGQIGGDPEFTVCETVILRDAKRSFARIICRDQTGAEVSRRDETLTGDPYTTEGEITGGGEQPECCPETTTLVLCDDNGPFLRHVTRTPAGETTVADTTLAGGLYEPVGDVTVCASGGKECEDKFETVELCDTYDAGAVTIPQTAWKMYEKSSGPNDAGFYLLGDGVPYDGGNTNSLEATIDLPPGAEVKFHAIRGVAGAKGNGKGYAKIFIGAYAATSGSRLTYENARMRTGDEDSTAQETLNFTVPDDGKVRFSVLGNGVTSELGDGERLTGSLFKPLYVEIVGQKRSVTVRFKRTTITKCDGTTEIKDTTADGKPYTTRGTVAECEDCPTVEWRSCTDTSAKQKVTFSRKITHPCVGADIIEDTFEGKKYTPFGDVTCTDVENEEEARRREGRADCPIEQWQSCQDVISEHHTVTFSKRTTTDCLGETETATFYGGKPYTLQGDEKACTDVENEEEARKREETSCPTDKWASCTAKRPNGQWIIYSRRTRTDCDGNETVTTTLNGKPYTPPTDADVTCEDVENEEEARKREERGCEGGRRTTEADCDFTIPEKWIPIDVTALPKTTDTPHAGKAGGIGFTVKAGQQGDDAPGYAFSKVNPNLPDGPQVWTFDRAVKVRLGLNNLQYHTTGLWPTYHYEGVKLSGGFTADKVHSNHTWDADKQTLVTKGNESIAGRSNKQESTLVADGVTEFTITDTTDSSVPKTQTEVGVSKLEIFQPGRVLRVKRTTVTECGTGELVSVTLTDPETGETIDPETGDLGDCNNTHLLECPYDEWYSCVDDGEEYVTTYSRHVHTPCEGDPVTTETYDGKPYKPENPPARCRKVENEEEAQRREKREEKPDCPTVVDEELCDHHELHGPIALTADKWKLADGVATATVTLPIFAQAVLLFDASDAFDVEVKATGRGREEALASTSRDGLDGRQSFALAFRAPSTHGFKVEIRYTDKATGNRDATFWPDRIEYSAWDSTTFTRRTTTPCEGAATVENLTRDKTGPYTVKGDAVDCETALPSPTCPAEQWASCTETREKGTITYSRQTITPCTGDPIVLATFGGKKHTATGDVTCSDVESEEEARRREESNLTECPTVEKFTCTETVSVDDLVPLRQWKRSTAREQRDRGVGGNMCTHKGAYPLTWGGLEGMDIPDRFVMKWDEPVKVTSFSTIGIDPRNQMFYPEGSRPVLSPKVLESRYKLRWNPDDHSLTGLPGCRPTTQVDFVSDAGPVSEIVLRGERQGTFMIGNLRVETSTKEQEITKVVTAPCEGDPVTRYEKDGKAYKPTGPVTDCTKKIDDGHTVEVFTCDFVVPGESHVIDLESLAESRTTPVQGTAGDAAGTTYTVKNGRQSVTTPGYSFSRQNTAEPDSPQEWTFDRPVKVRLGINNLDNLRDGVHAATPSRERVKVPEGFVLEELGDGHLWDEASRELASDGFQADPAESGPIESIFVHESTSGFTVEDVSDLGADAAAQKEAAVAVCRVEVFDPPQTTQVTRVVEKDASGTVVSDTLTDADGAEIDPDEGTLGNCTERE